MTFLARRPAPIIIAALAALGVFLVLAAGPATADPSIASKREQAQAVLAQIRALDSSLELASEAYNLADLHLSQIDANLKTNGRHLVIAR